mgnify:CR=1 FL=1
MFKFQAKNTKAFEAMYIFVDLWTRGPTGLYMHVLHTSFLMYMRVKSRLATSYHDEAFAGGASSGSPDGDRSLWKLIWHAYIPQKKKIIV